MQRARRRPSHRTCGTTSTSAAERLLRGARASHPRASRSRRAASRARISSVAVGATTTTWRGESGSGRSSRRASQRLTSCA
eukprot:1613434-Prymnesium_polylepis.1